jgi:hypothetical protein
METSAMSGTAESAGKSKTIRAEGHGQKGPAFWRNAKFESGADGTLRVESATLADPDFYL